MTMEDFCQYFEDAHLCNSTPDMDKDGDSDGLCAYDVITFVCVYMKPFIHFHTIGITDQFGFKKIPEILFLLLSYEQYVSIFSKRCLDLHQIYNFHTVTSGYPLENM